MSKRKCYRCGKDPAGGYASVWTAKDGERWYCHGDDDEVSCYERQAWPGSDRLPITEVEAVRMYLDRLEATTTHPGVLSVIAEIRGELGEESIKEGK